MILTCFFIIGCAKLGKNDDPLRKTPGLNANEVGNGGDVVACRDGREQLESVRLLDYYEAGGVDLGEPSLTVADKIHLVLSRLSKLDPNRAAEYLERDCPYDLSRRDNIPDLTHAPLEYFNSEFETFPFREDDPISYSKSTGRVEQLFRFQDNY